SDGRISATGFSLMGSGYVGLGNTPAGYGGQLYQYTVATNSWALKQYYPGPQTSNASVSMTIGNRAFVYKDGTWTEFNFFTTSSFSSKICTNETLSISFDASNFTFPPNTTFTAQVSTQSNFSVGTNLGTFNSTGSSGVVVANFLPTIPAGNYYFRIVTNNSPAFSTFSEIVKITAIPASQTINPVGGSTVCKDVAVVFTSNLTGPNFQWFKNNNLVGTDAPTYTDATLANSDVVKAVKIFTVGCSQPTAIGSNLVTMKVRTSAKPVVTTVGNTLSSTAATAYQWFENGSAISKATGQSFVITESGIYKVRTTDINGCDAFSDDLSSVFTGLFGEELSNRINTYPNPVSGEMILEVADDLVMQGANYSVLNELGQQVIASQTASVTNKINLTGRTSGLYLVRLTISGSTVVRRVVKVD
ncbi:MAG TPA: T9SS type A sorting domain-containing protein, partial [Cyclobacteriaceae bacterium]